MNKELKAKMIEFCKKLAKKNKFCLNLAAVILVVYIIVDKIIYYNRYRFARVLCTCFILVSFFTAASFTPMRFDDGSYDIVNYDEIVLLDSQDADEEDYLITEVDNEEDMASLDDLIETTKDEDMDDVENGLVKTEFDRNDWKLLLVNKTHTIPEDYTFTLGTIKGNMKCDERIIKPLMDMFAGAKEDGVNLIVCSPYRDMSRQEYLFERKMKNYINMGYSYIDAYKVSSQAVTVPGASEHQIGLSLDILCDSYNTLDDGFGETEAGKWLVENSYKYGFILRYPEGKEYVTGIMYEPWHFRYVGVEAATVMHDNNLTLEEFVESL